MASKSTGQTRATSLVVTKLPCTLINVQGYWAGAADAWLQIYDSNATAAAIATATTAPVKTYALSAASPFSWSFGDTTGLSLATGCVVAISTLANPNQLVLPTGGGNVADIEVEYGPTAYFGSEPTAIAQAASADSAAIWTSGLHRLITATVVNGEAFAVFLLLFATTAAASAKPLMAWPIAVGETLALNFGVNGLGVFDGAGNKKCYLYLSVSGTELDATGLTAASTFDATYV